MTVYELIQSCMPSIGLPITPIQSDIVDMALASYNVDGKTVFNAWPWDNSKLDEFTSPTPDSGGIITFAANVDIIRAIRYLDAGTTDFTEEGTGTFNEDEILSARYGLSVGEDKWQTLADSTAGYRRIKVPTDNITSVIRVLAAKRFTPAVISAAYDPANPTATPTDYRVLSFEIDRAEPALREYMVDALRTYLGMGAVGKASTNLQVAINRETGQQNKEVRIEPKSPMFKYNRFNCN